MAQDITYLASFKGSEVYPVGTSLNVRETPTTTAKIVKTVPYGVLAGKANGFKTQMKDGAWYHILFSGGGGGYVRSDVVKVVPPTVAPVTSPVTDNPTQKDALSIAQKLVDSDMAVHKNLLLIDTLIQTSKAKGLSTSTYESKLTPLYTRLVARQDYLKNSKALKVQTAINKTVTQAVKDWVSADSKQSPWAPAGTVYMRGIGAVQFAIVVYVAAGALLAGSLYFILKPKYSESQTDLKISSDLKSLLEKTDPETAKKITDNLEKQIDDGYNQGKTDQKFGDILSVLKPVAWAVGGFLLVTKVILPSVNNAKSK